MATEQDYQTGTAALAKVISDAIDANVPAFERNMVPQAMVAQIEESGAKAVIDAVDAARAQANQTK